MSWRILPELGKFLLFSAIKPSYCDVSREFSKQKSSERQSFSEQRTLPLECVALKGGSAAAEKPIAGFLFPAWTDLYSSLFLVSKVELHRISCHQCVRRKSPTSSRQGNPSVYAVKAVWSKRGDIAAITSFLCILLGLWEHGMDFMGDTYLWHLRKKRRGDEGPELGWSMAQW